MFDRRNDYLFCISEDLAIAYHRRGEKDVRNVFVFNLQLDQLHVAVKMDELIAVEVFAFDAEQHIAIVSRRDQHYWRLLSRAKRILVDDDLQSAVPVTEIGAATSRYPYRCLGFDRRALIVARPSDSIVAFTLRRKAELAFSVSVRLCELR